MKLHLLCPDDNADLGEVLFKALVRSFTRSQVKIWSLAEWHEAIDQGNPVACVIASPADGWTDGIMETLGIPGSKVLLLGKIPLRLAHALGATVTPLSPELQESAACASAPAFQFTESKAVIRYRNTERHLGIPAPVPSRPCLRFDFTDEWNNLGYGAIRADGSIWSLAQIVNFPEEQTLAAVEVGGEAVSAYAALRGNGVSSLLWFNRPVGPVDSQEWRLVERYFSSVGYPKAACLPVVQEIPAGYNAAVTMRLDCDEDIASAKPLFDFYRAERIPFSLAVHSKVLADARHLPLLQAVHESGGSILTHSATHPVNWGGSYDAALQEVKTSRTAIMQAVKDANVRYAVSPFHQNPPYAVAAMADGGLSGFVGGIIRNDPEYLIARGGEVPFGSKTFVSHSQQCMLHGDCMLKEGDPLAVFRQAFDMARQGGALFGYLDHPFSERYQYGWLSEEQRLAAHRDFVAYIRKVGKVLFLSEDQALDWIAYKASVQVHDRGGRYEIASSLPPPPWPLRLEFGGAEIVPERLAA